MRPQTLTISLVLALSPWSVPPAVAAGSGVVSGSLSGDEKMLREQVERVLPLLYDHPRVIIARYHDISPDVVVYLPSLRAFMVGGTEPGPWGVTPHGLLVWTPARLVEVQVPDPAVDYTDGLSPYPYLLYHDGKAYEVHTYEMSAATVTVIYGPHPYDAEDLASFDLPDDLRLRYPRLADVEFELSREYCTFRYYYINPERPDSYLELTVRINLHTNQPEFDYRIVHDPKRARELL